VRTLADLWPDGVFCPAAIDGRSNFFDGNHISTHGAVRRRANAARHEEQMSRARRWTCLAACAALLLLVVFVNPPTHTTLGYVLHKSAHPAVFALIALIYLNLAAEAAQWWKPYLGALSVVLVCGVGTEIAQSLLNRDPSIVDVVRDATGAVASLATALLVQRWVLISRTLRVCLVLVATAATLSAAMPLVWCLSAYATRDSLFPTILEYRSPLDMYFVKRGTGGVSGIDLPAEWAVRPGEKAIVVHLDNAKPGIRLFEPHPDWRGYTVLSFDMTNPNRIPIDLVVRVNAEAADYCDVRFELPSRIRATLKLRLDEIHTALACRELDMSEVAGIALFVQQPMTRGEFYVSRIWLE